MKQIFEPVKLRHIGTELRNRLVRSATWEGLAAPDGSITEESYEIYSELAKGGIGAIITGFTSVARHDYYFGGMMRLCADGLIPMYRKLTEIIHAEHVPVLTELALGAFYRKTGAGYEQTEPDEMTRDEIKLVIEQFVAAAVRAQQAGFDGVQIHAAHFFFLSRFISPAVNHRTDEYGGSTENRARILLKIIDGIRSAAPDLHITIKINCNDFSYRGLDEAQSFEICQLLDRAGIDSIEVSGNGTSVSGIRPHVNEGYFVPAAAKIAQAVSCPVIVVGGLRSLDVMQAIVNRTEIALIALSRPLLHEPELPRRMQADPSAVSKCISCNACYSSQAHRCIYRHAKKEDLG